MAAKLYLATYNTLQALCWAAAFVATSSVWAHKDQVWPKAGPLIRLGQGAAALEVVHAITGLVKGSPAMAALQWVGRANVLFAILACVPEVQSSWPVFVTFWAWSLSEVIRYPWYLASTVGKPPAWLTWLRYTMFIPLYPMGIAGEMAIVYLALPHMDKRQLHSMHLPNAFNFAFSYPNFCRVGLYCLMPAGFLWLYTTMLTSRSKRLRAGKAQGKAA